MESPTALCKGFGFVDTTLHNKENVVQYHCSSMMKYMGHAGFCNCKNGVISTLPFVHYLLFAVSGGPNKQVNKG